MVGRQPELARQGLDGAFVHRAIVAAKGGEPSPHDTPTVVGEHAFGRKKIDAPLCHPKKALLLAADVQPAMGVWHKLLFGRIPIADVVAAADVVADAQQHPFVADGEEIWARDVFAVGYIGQIVGQEVAYQRPGAQIGRFEQWRVFATRYGVIDPINHETIRVPVIHVGRAAIRIVHFDWVGWQPAGQLTVGGQHELIAPRTLAVVDDGRLAGVRHKPRAAEHTVPREGGLQRRRVPRPMQHVGATDMHKRKRFLPAPRVRQNVVQMVDPIQVQCRIGIAGQARATGVHQVVVDWCLSHCGFFW